jgi:hypothetical protein
MKSSTAARSNWPPAPASASIASTDPSHAQSTASSMTFVECDSVLAVVAVVITRPCAAAIRRTDEARG